MITGNKIEEKKDESSDEELLDESQGQSNRGFDEDTLPVPCDESLSSPLRKPLCDPWALPGPVSGRGGGFMPRAPLPH